MPEAGPISAQTARWKVSLSALVGFALATLAVIIFVSQGTAELRARVEAERKLGFRIIFENIGDVPIRDVPKAQEFLQGRFTTDMHYTDNAAWYPFMTPLISAAVARLTGERVVESYLLVGIWASGLTMLAVALLLSAHLRWVGLAAFFAGMALNWMEVSSTLDTYPASTSRLPFTLFLLVAGVAAVQANHPHQKRIWLTYATMGVLQGALSLWHGASFFTSLIVTACVAAWQCWVAFRRRDARAALPLIALFAPFALLFGWLIVPQLITYGHLQQADKARLLLWADFAKAGGNSPGQLLRLALVPRDLDLILLAVFALASATNFYPHARTRGAPILLAYAFAIGIARLGFVVNSDKYPWLAAIARAVMLAPPHTFLGLADFILAIIRLLSLGVVVIGGLKLARLALARARATAPDGLRWARPIVITAFIVVAAALWLRRKPIAELHRLDRIGSSHDTFAETVSELAADSTVYGIDGTLMQIASVKPLFLQSDIHVNPYAQPERFEAYFALASAVARRDMSAYADLVNRFRIHYAVSTGRGFAQDPFLVLCTGAPIAAEKDFFAVVPVHPTCKHEALQYGPSQVLTTFKSQADLKTTMSDGLVIAGISSDDATFGTLEFERLPVKPGGLYRLSLTGEVLGADTSSCVAIGGESWLDATSANMLRESGERLNVQGRFTTSIWLATPEGARFFSPRVNAMRNCLKDGQRLRLDSIELAEGR